MKPTQAGIAGSCLDLMGDERHYGLSRSLYRAAADCAKHSALADGERVRLLDACEYAVGRLADNPPSGRCVARWLYREVHSAYALEDRPVLSAALRRRIEVAAELLKEAQFAQTRVCSAVTRSGAPCQRQARPGSEFCPSHRHLGLILVPEAAAPAAAAAEAA